MAAKVAKAPRAPSAKALPTGASVLFRLPVRDTEFNWDVCCHIEKHMFKVVRRLLPVYSTATHKINIQSSSRMTLATCKEWTVPLYDAAYKSKLHVIHRPCAGPARVYENGTRVWYHFDTIHRSDGPAIILPDGGEIWMHDGRLHRVGGPAVSLPCGYRAWFVCGALSNPAGPALVEPQPDGTVREQYFLHGVRHRVDGPAGDDNWTDSFSHNVSQPWYYGGKLHRDDGPARVVRANAGRGHYTVCEEYYQHGFRHRAGGPAVSVRDHHGRLLREEWHYLGIQHCPTGPSERVWHASPDSPPDRPLIAERVAYHVQGILHRTDGPAVATWWPCGTRRSELWYSMGRPHRDGDAAHREWDDTDVLVKEEWRFAGIFHRVGGPAHTDTTTIEYLFAGELHRIDGPASVRPDGAVSTDVHAVAGELHRVNGPAKHSENGKAQHVVFGKLVSKSALKCTQDVLHPPAHKRAANAPLPRPAKKRRTQSAASSQ